MCISENDILERAKTRNMFSTTATRLCYFLCITLVVIPLFHIKVVNGLPKCMGFKDNADDFFEVRYHQKQRRGKTITDVTNAVILWDPQEMLDVPTCYDLSKSTLQFTLLLPDEANEHSSSNNTDIIPPRYNFWQTVNVDPNEAGKKSKWLIDDIIPCLKYVFRIVVTKYSQEDVGQEIDFISQKTLGPSDEEMIKGVRYQPEPPYFMNATVTESMAKLHWSPSHCADSYDLIIKDEAKEGEGQYEALEGNSTSYRALGLKACTNYEATLSGNLHDEYGDAFTYEFSTLPQEDTSDKLNLTADYLTINSTSVSFSVDIWPSGVACLEE